MGIARTEPDRVERGWENQGEESNRGGVYTEFTFFYPMLLPNVELPTVVSPVASTSAKDKVAIVSTFVSCWRLRFGLNSIVFSEGG